MTQLVRHFSGRVLVRVRVLRAPSPPPRPPSPKRNSLRPSALQQRLPQPRNPVTTNVSLTKMNSVRGRMRDGMNDVACTKSYRNNRDICRNNWRKKKIVARTADPSPHGEQRETDGAEKARTELGQKRDEERKRKRKNERTKCEQGRFVRQCERCEANESARELWRHPVFDVAQRSQSEHIDCVSKAITIEKYRRYSALAPFALSKAVISTRRIRKRASNHKRALCAPFRMPGAINKKC